MDAPRRLGFCVDCAVARDRARARYFSVPLGKVRVYTRELRTGRLIDHDLLLWDVDADVIIDVLPDALPRAGS